MFVLYSLLAIYIPKMRYTHYLLTIKALYFVFSFVESVEIHRIV